jgi:hypothetical protein
MLDPKAATLSAEQAKLLPLTNIHFHLGAEHTSEQYSDNLDSAEYDIADDSEGPRPGFMCAKDDLKETDMGPYTFKHCKGEVEVGKTYEVHYVHSSAGYSEKQLETKDVDGVDDGLIGAANGRHQLNPMIVVQGVVFQIVNGGEEDDSIIDGLKDYVSSVMYPGSTTGTSFDNEVCSPYAITWHVDRKCHRVSPESFDNFCKQLKERYGEKKDLHPHGSRKLVQSDYVVKWEYVRPLA